MLETFMTYSTTRENNPTLNPLLYNFIKDKATNT